ncbi:PASTA domain-containing protein [Paractinoplanes durhamensis]|uniref:PASTA domain-containing protein n=1 Tax=Paractinoplanes durhamensis TaxID=113563 RepID=A0ABQ3Z629_9ACTN|nr:PASTA domain-containing protein [Actinoplanes durhamensis]GIE05280.1 hypothetical protein Adu01nite_66300 [Actinoplanes durhamensis]
MSDESDETRSFSPFDETEAGASGGKPKSPEPDATVADGDILPSDADATRLDQGAIRDEATRVTPRADATSVMPPAEDDWAASRAKPVWSGRAEVRAPQPGRSSYDTDWQAGPPPGAVQKDRWWMPIVVGIVVLILLALLGWGIYLIVQNSGNDTKPATTPTTTAATSAAPSASATTPSSQPTTPSASPTTTEPTQSEVLVPALLGLALDDARDALNQTGLRYRVLYRDSTAPAGTVIDSDPAEGQEVPPDTRVTIVVAGTGASTAPSSAVSASAGSN